jgi:hypothetical protein
MEVAEAAREGQQMSPRVESINGIFKQKHKEESEDAYILMKGRDQGRYSFGQSCTVYSSESDCSWRVYCFVSFLLTRFRRLGLAVEGNVICFLQQRLGHPDSTFPSKASLAGVLEIT